MEMLEDFKSAKLKNMLMTGLNNRLLANLQEKITESKSAATLSARKDIDTIEEQKNSSDDGTRNTNNESTGKESNQLSGSG